MLTQITCNQSDPYRKTTSGLEAFLLQRWQVCLVDEEFKDKTCRQQDDQSWALIISWETLLHKMEKYTLHDAIWDGNVSSQVSSLSLSSHGWVVG